MDVTLKLLMIIGDGVCSVSIQEINCDVHQLLIGGNGIDPDTDQGRSF